VAVHYSIQDSGDALRIFVRSEISLFLRVVCGGFAASIIWFVVGTHLPNVWRSVLAIAAGLSVIVFFRVTTARLLATKFEFQLDGADDREPEGGSSRRGVVTILTAKIYRLEYQEHDSGGQGIYAVTATGEPLLLPYVDASQAEEIISAIKRKFPGLAELWRMSEAAAAKSVAEKSGSLF
jgi:hypothetical protein